MEEAVRMVRCSILLLAELQLFVVCLACSFDVSSTDAVLLGTTGDVGCDATSGTDESVTHWVIGSRTAFFRLGPTASYDAPQSMAI